MTDKEAMKLALDALNKLTDVFLDTEGSYGNYETNAIDQGYEAITAIKERLAQPEQEPVGWLLTDKNINSLQVDSIQRLIDRLKHAHHTDVCVRINGQDEWFQADWLKHMVRATPPQRKPLTDDEMKLLWAKHGYKSAMCKPFARAIEAAHGIKENT